MIALERKIVLAAIIVRKKAALLKKAANAYNMNEYYKAADRLDKYIEVWQRKKAENKEALGF